MKYIVKCKLSLRICIEYNCLENSVFSDSSNFANIRYPSSCSFTNVFFVPSSPATFFKCEENISNNVFIAIQYLMSFLVCINFNLQVAGHVENIFL